MTRQELASKAKDATAELVAAGWDYDDARFATMALVNGGILDEQMAGVTTPAIEELKALFATVDKSVAPVKAWRCNSDDEMEDQ